MMKKSSSMTVRFDDRTFMQIREIAKEMKCNYSVVVRALVQRSLEDLQAKEGYGEKEEKLGVQCISNADDS